MPRSTQVCLVLLLLHAAVSLTLEEISDYEGGTEEMDVTEGPGALVELPLGVTQGLYDMTRNIGRSVTFTCSITGQAPLNLFIMHDRIATYRNRNRKRRIFGETIYDPEKPNELSVVYAIEETEENQAGIYKCQGESASGEIIVSTSELTLLDPCDGIQCGFKEQCVNNRGNGICTCDFDCDETLEEEDAVCVGGLSYSSLCHLTRSECRAGQALSGSGIERGRCADQPVLTEASCSITGEGHVTKFNGDYFTFQGTCPYKMAEDTRQGVLVVYARTEACGDDSLSNCLRSITIYVDRIYGFSIERGWLINDNGRSRNLQNGETLVLGGGLVSITRIGKTMSGRIENDDIQFFYDGLNYFKLTVPFSHVDAHTDFGGFCGSIPVDYVPSAIGRDISLLGDIEMPALAATDRCEPDFGARECENVDVIEADVRATFENSEGLAACATVVPMEMYVARAIQDTCSCAMSQDINYCFCNLAFAYKEDCRQAGVEVAIEEDICAKSFHQDAFKSEGISYKRYRRWYAMRKSI